MVVRVRVFQNNYSWIPVLYKLLEIASTSPSDVDGSSAEEPRECRTSPYPAGPLDARTDLLKFKLPARCTACSSGRVEQPALRQE